MLQILGVAIAADCDNIAVDCSEVVQKRKVAKKSKQELKEQSNFRLSVGGALTSFAANETVQMANETKSCHSVQHTKFVAQ
jgi:hypothetical protein